MFSKDFFKSIKNIGIPEHMVNRAQIGFNEFWKPIKILFEQQTLPENGWEDSQIKSLLNVLSNFDSDKDPNAIRIGEREARLATPLLNDLCAGFSHGIGRSGQLSAAQPKAAGASIMQKITNKLALSLIKELGLPNIKAAITLPLGTGMGISLALKGIYDHYNMDIHTKPNILYCRADHRSPQKGIQYIGGILQTIEGKFGENHYAPEGVFIDIEDIKETYENSSSSIGAIISTTSFFAPRVPDNIKEISKFAQEKNIIHIINNAYGIQSPELIKLIRSSIDAGRVDAVVQSTDKNFLTPVGGSLILSPKKEIIESISSSYAGRASAIPIVHLLVSLLSMGISGYKALLEEQKKNSDLLEKKLQKLAETINEQVIDCKNRVSYAISLSNLKDHQIKELGGFLYNLRVTGPRVVNTLNNSFGSCTENMPWPYIVVNAAIGVKEEHINKSIEKLEEALNQIHKNP